MNYAGFLIRQKRLEKGWSQEGLCRGVCAVSYLSKIEQGKAVLIIKVIAIIKCFKEYMEYVFIHKKI